MNTWIYFPRHQSHQSLSPAHFSQHEDDLTRHVSGIKLHTTHSPHDLHVINASLGNIRFWKQNNDSASNDRQSLQEFTHNITPTRIPRTCSGGLYELFYLQDTSSGDRYYSYLVSEAINTYFIIILPDSFRDNTQQIVND